MHCVLSVVTKNVHDKQLVRQDHDLSLGLVALAILVFFLHEYTTTRTVCVSFRWGRAKYFTHFFMERWARSRYMHFNLFRGGIEHDLASKRQWVCYLSKVLAAVTDAGVFTIELDTWIGTLYLGQLLLHTLMRVGVQFR